MERHNLAQGSPEWLAHRDNCWNAGDAAAMLGCSPNETRDQLLARLHSGVHKEFSDYVQEHVIDPGYEFEDNARVLAEEVIGEDLGRVVGSLAVGLSRPLGASFDGITFMDDTVWEHKTLNESLRYSNWDEGNGAHLPKSYRVQMEQQLLVSGAERALFMASKWKPDGTLDMARKCWYVSDAALRAEILAGWKLLEADLANYVPGQVVDKVVAKAVTALPSVTVQVSGEIAVRDNFASFEMALRDFIDKQLIRKPETDQDFADLDLQIKALKKAEEAMAAAEEHMLAQVASVDSWKRTKDMLHKLARDNRLMAEKLLAAEKERIKADIVAGGAQALREHIANLNTRLGKPYMPAIASNFPGVIKGLRTVDSLRNAVGNELMRTRLEANDIADRIEINLRHLREHAKDHSFLFADTAAIVLKAPDDLQAIVTSRVAEHQRKEAERQEQERERIRAEEVARLQKEALEEQRANEAEAQRKAAEAIKTAATPAPQPEPVTLERVVTTVAPAVVARAITPAVDASENATMKLGDICARLRFTVTADFLAELGFAAVVDKGARLYPPSQFPAICSALIEHLNTVADEVPA